MVFTQCFSLVLVGEELKPCIDCCVEVDDEGTIVGVGAARPSGTETKHAVVMPPPCNAHTHMLDYCMLEAGEELALEELVSLPSGLKYRVLSSLPTEDLLRAALEGLEIVKRSSHYVASYAELAPRGARILLKASERLGLTVRVLAQPLEKSLRAYLGAAREFGGLGMDTLFDLAPEDLRKLNAELRGLEVVVHVHVSETRKLHEARDYELLPLLKPTAVVHGTYFDRDVLAVLEEVKAGWILCPRSSQYFEGRTADPVIVFKAWREGIPVALGTDNAAWFTPNIWLEASFAYTTWRWSVSNREDLAKMLLESLTVRCAELARFRDYPVVDVGTSSELVAVVEIPGLRWSRDPILTLVKRGYEGRLNLFASWHPAARRC